MKLMQALKQESWRHKAFAVFLCILAGFYGPMSFRHYVGQMSDDARDILAAKSILLGSYLNLQLPNHPPVNFPLPGFPLFLAPFVAIVEPHWSWLKIIPIVLTLTCVLLTRELFKDLLSEYSLWILLALFSINPCTVEASGRVIADSCYLFAVLLIFLMLRRQVSEENLRNAWLLGVISAWAALVRPEGFCLIASVGLGLVIGKRWRSLGPFAASTLLLAGIVIWRNHKATGSVSGYMRIWSEILPMIREYLPILWNAQRVLCALTMDLMLGIPSARFDALLTGVAETIVVGLYFYGATCLYRRILSRQALIAAVFFYCISHVVLHSFWFAVSNRYMWPLLPFALAFTIEAVAMLSRRFWHPRYSTGALALIIAVLYVRQDAIAVMEVISKPLVDRPQTATADWVRTHLPSTAFILTPDAPWVTLETDRWTWAYISSTDVENYRYKTFFQGITHVWLAPAKYFYVPTISTRDPTRLWKASAQWLPSSPESFRLVYKNTAETTAIYQVIPAVHFFKSYVSYLYAYEDFERGNWPKVFRALDDSLKQYPQMTSSLNLYGAALMLSGGNLDLAKTKFEKAVQLRPDFIMAFINLARVNHRLGHRKEALEYYERAKQTIIANNDQEFLLQIIEKERQQL